MQSAAGGSANETHEGGTASGMMDLLLGARQQHRARILGEKPLDT